MAGMRVNPRRYLQVVMRGGLGNQLFQYFAALHYSRLLGLQVEVNVMSYSNKPRFRLARREFALPQFNFLPSYEVVAFRGKPFFSKIAQRSIIEKDSYNFITDTERAVSLDHRKIVLDGYFQESTYVTEFEDYIFRWLALNAEQQAHLDMLKREILHQDFIMIHLRLGDYLYLDEFPTLSSSLLDRVVNYIGQISPTTEGCYVVTDSEFEFVQKYKDFLSKNNVKLIKTAGVEPAVVIHLLSSAKTLIMSKSSLSWWGGLLCSMKGQRVFVPYCFGEHQRGCFRDDQILPNWTKF